MPTQAKKTRCLVGLRRKKRSEGNRHQETTRNFKALLTYKPSRYIICNIVTYKISREYKSTNISRTAEYLTRYMRRSN